MKSARAPRAVQARPSGRGRTSAKGPPAAVGSARRTRDHDEIRNWVERHGGCPAAVKRTSTEGVGILRIDFPGFSGKTSLEQISWDDFFKKFDEAGLEFLYQERTKSGRPSRFNKLVSAEA